MLNRLRQSQSATDSQWEEIAKAYHEKVGLLRAHEKRIQDGYDELQRKRDEMALRHGVIADDRSVKGNDIFDISAGGTIVPVTRETLTLVEGSLLAELFSGRWEKRLLRDGNGCVLLDVNASCFQSLVDYLNERKISPPEDPPDPPIVDEEDQVFMDKMLQMFGLDELCSRRHPVLSLVGGTTTSTTLTDPFHAQALTDFLLEDEIGYHLELLYRGSRDGFGASDFHTKCDHKGATVTVIQDSNGHLFGGYAEMSWESHPEGQWKRSEKSFLFALNFHSNSLDKPMKMRPKDGKEDDSMASHERRGPVFGRCDLVVALTHDQANNGNNNNNKSKINIGKSYNCPLGQNGKTFLTGDEYFEVAEMEVFRVIDSQQPPDVVQSQAVGCWSDDDGKEANVLTDESWETVTFEEFPESMKDALTAEQCFLVDANEELKEQEHAWQREMRFIDYIAPQEAENDGGKGQITMREPLFVSLNASGTMMSTKKATLGIYEQSVLAKQFHDPVWMDDNDTAAGPVKKWSIDQVATWVFTNIQNGLSVSDGEQLKAGKLNGAELLVLEREDLKELGITRPGSLAMLVDAIRKLRRKEEDKNDHRKRMILIEHNAYCFGKILDQLRLCAMYQTFRDNHWRIPGVVESPPFTIPPQAPPPPIVREPYRKRFKTIVEFYFPEDYASFLA